MSKLNFQVNVSPEKAFELLRRHPEADLVHEELHDAGEGRQFGTMIFEKYYLRAGNRAALVVMLDNLQGTTEVRVVATGSGQGMFFKMDWGAADDLARTVERVFWDHKL